jgi:hypothetical protein
MNYALADLDEREFEAVLMYNIRLLAHEITTYGECPAKETVEGCIKRIAELNDLRPPRLKQAANA